MECAIEGCSNRVLARGWCAKHYQRWRAHGDPRAHSPQDLSAQERFWNKVDRSASCWMWTAGIRGDGYGAFQVESNRQIGAHRYSFELHHGEIPHGMVVMHSCDEPRCVNPSHLSLGTVADNAADASRKGRRLPGSQNHQAKLTEQQVLELRRRYAAGGVTHAQLASEYGVSHALISHILSRRAWKHI